MLRASLRPGGMQGGSLPYANDKARRKMNPDTRHALAVAGAGLILLAIGLWALLHHLQVGVHPAPMAMQNELGKWKAPPVHKVQDSLLNHGHHDIHHGHVDEQNHDDRYHHNHDVHDEHVHPHHAYHHVGGDYPGEPPHYAAEHYDEHAHFHANQHYDSHENYPRHEIRHDGDHDHGRYDHANDHYNYGHGVDEHH